MLDHAVIDSVAADQSGGSQRNDEESSVPTSDVLIENIERLLQAGRPAAARPLLLALRRLAPQAPKLGLLEAQLLVAEGRPEAAIDVLRAAIDSAHQGGGEGSGAGLVDLYLLRGEIQVGMGRFAPALDDTAAAVVSDRQAPLAKLRLGVLLTQIGRFDDAIACLRESVATEPSPAALRGLATAYERSGRARQATELLAEAIRTWPKDKELRTAAVMISMRARNFVDAIATAELARQDGAISAELFAVMGDALAYLGRHAEAAEAYHDGLKFSPTDLFMPHYAALSAAASDANNHVAHGAIRALNDLAAPDYDHQVLSRADRGPGLVRRTLQCELAMGDLPAGPVLDLGCGTGLVGLAVAEFAGPLTGYDLSPAMLAAARVKRVYAELQEGDLLALLAADERSWPVILASGSLPYYGALESVFARVQARLAPGGRFIFSLADADADGSAAADVGWRLSRGGCNVHRQSYVTQALATAGLVARRFEAEVLCHETDVPVPGWIIIAGHAADAQEGGL